MALRYNHPPINPWLFLLTGEEYCGPPSRDIKRYKNASMLLSLLFLKKIDKFACRRPAKQKQAKYALRTLKVVMRCAWRKSNALQYRELGGLYGYWFLERSF